MFVCMYTCVEILSEPRGCWVPWSWSYRELGATLLMWTLNSGPLKQQQVLLTAELSVQPFLYFLKCTFSWWALEFEGTS